MKGEVELDKRKKVCLVSSSGGHYEQLKMLKPLGERYDIFFVTDKTGYENGADYSMIQTGLTDKLVLFRMFGNLCKAFRIFVKEKPDVVITTGTMVAIPFMYLCKLFRRKFVYIETFSRVYDGTRAGKYLYKHADLFLYQWETLKDVYPNGIYGGGLY